MANIKNNNYRKIDCRLIRDKYMDFMLSKDDAQISSLGDECYAAKLNFNNIKGKNVISNISWVNAKQSDKELLNIGYTGVDNGFITYDKDRIANDEFLELYTNTKFDLSTYGTKFFITEVNGNSGLLTYPIEKHDNYVALKGGFYQGFFKIHGDDYQTLPQYIHDEWNFNITLRKKNYETLSNTLNKRHPSNEGIFLYIGTRAENKFWELYKTAPKMENFKYNDLDDYCTDYNIMDGNVITKQYQEESNDSIFDNEYLQEQIDLTNIKLKDSKGNAIGEKGFYEIETDNKFIFFNQTKNGFTIKTWKDYYKFILTGKKDCPTINYFPYLNQTANGYTKDDIEDLNSEHSYEYDVFKDIENNALGFKINNDGSISYRLLTKNCEIVEESTFPSLIKDDEWYNIHIKIVRKPSSIECEKYHKQDTMQLYIYVNGFLKMVSKELPELMLSPLDDTPERQEGVPYNISIGGGTQGLMERILLNYYDKTDYTLPLEENFGGSFIGDIKTFSFLPCKIDFPTIYEKRGGF